METITYQGNIIEVVQREVEQNGKKKMFEFARRSPGTRLIISKEGSILLTKEFRHELGTYDYRLPGGKVYDTLNEYNSALELGTDIAEAAKFAALKEAREEVGAEASTAKFVHKSVLGATVVWDLYYFAITDFAQREQQLEDGEDITVGWYTQEQVRAMCLSGEVSEERSALVLLRFLADI